MFDFDPQEILAQNNVEVTWWDSVVDDYGIVKKEGAVKGWGLSWKHGAIYIGPCLKHKAIEGAAIFVLLWLKGVSAQMATQLIIAYAFIESYHDAIETYSGFINNIEHFCREGHETVRGSIRIQPE